MYGVANGLPEQTIQAFAQTPDHYLWIGTTGGLARFDGAHFTVFDRENTPAFHENSVFCLLAAKDGSLWIGTEGGGLLHYRDGNFTGYGQAEGLTDMFVRALAQDAAGNIWAGTNNGIFSIGLADAHLKRIDGDGHVPALAVNAICQDMQGRLWLGGSRLISIQAGHVRFYQLPGDAARNRVKAVAETEDPVVPSAERGVSRWSPDHASSRRPRRTALHSRTVEWRFRIRSGSAYRTVENGEIHHHLRREGGWVH
jgi:ligand-binding sensor domain-containing protein